MQSRCVIVGVVFQKSLKMKRQSSIESFYITKRSKDCSHSTDHESDETQNSR